MSRSNFYLILYFVSLFSFSIYPEKVWAQSQNVVSKSYYTPVYKRADTNSEVVGNLLKDQRAEEVMRKPGFVKINAFRGLIVGWVKESDLHSTVSPQRRGSSLETGASPVHLRLRNPRSGEGRFRQTDAGEERRSSS